jgi:hypothetical protein
MPGFSPIINVLTKDMELLFTVLERFLVSRLLILHVVRCVLKLARVLVDNHCVCYRSVYLSVFLSSPFVYSETVLISTVNKRERFNMRYRILVL